MTLPEPADLPSDLPPVTGAEWWRTAVIYQIYPRSFADLDGDGIGDLAGHHRPPRRPRRARRRRGLALPVLDSPQQDAGYDVADYCDVDPLFGTLGRLRRDARRGARARPPGHRRPRAEPLLRPARVVPGRRSPPRPAAAERDRYMFRDGQGKNGELPPNNWESVFGGPAWTRVTEADGTPGQWYLHIFDSLQPDLDWNNPEVREQFRGILRFWLDRGVDGFRVDVAHGLIKADGLPDYTPAGAMPAAMGGDDDRRARTGLRTACTRSTATGTACSPSTTATACSAPRRGSSRCRATALWVRPDEMHQAFNFPYLDAVGCRGPARR